MSIPHELTSLDDQLDDSQMFYRDDRPIVLCVDDDPDVVRSLEMRLGQQGFRSICAFNGMQAYWRVVNEKPDVVITDISMPQGDGTCLLESLKRNPLTASIPVIALSGMQGKDLPGRMCNLGAERFVRKPVDFNALLELITSLVISADTSASDNINELS